MREKLNSNPVAQIALIGALLLAAGFFVMSSMGGGGSEGGEESESSAASATEALGEAAPAEAEAPVGLDAALAMVSQASAGAAPLPRPVYDAWKAGDTVVLLFVHDGGIDDRIATDAIHRLAAMPGVATFIVPASKISRYAAITEGVGVSRVPALVVVRPKRLHEAVPTASVSYGFQSGESVVQAVIDAGYEGPTVDYHP
jgi:hypothetical protein